MTTVERLFELCGAEAPEGSRVELIEGEVHVSPLGDGQHAEVVAELCDRFTDRERQIGCYTGIGLKAPGVPAEPGGPDRTDGRAGPIGNRLLPDLVLAPRGSFKNELVWQSPDPVLLVAEVTSSSTASRDRVQKIRAYARAGIPLYLLIDREAGEAAVCSGPAGDDYDHKSVHKLGTPVPIPAPLGFTLDTAEF
ncbi:MULTISPECIES: Uma2 family endonuclease [unclassified Streptomyces]|uniref:Uma2 family endonuclease n=1 Tax=unclassified Streptomyces TaxID=2593676 RepID=UPI0033AF5EBB